MYPRFLTAVLFAFGFQLFVQAQTSEFPPCDALISAGLGDRVVLPTSGQYELRVNSYWNVNSRLRPNCFVLPQSTQEVSRIIKTLATKRSHNDDWHIAVRSGGHHLPGFSNIAKGVTIDLSLMKSSTYNPRTKLASIQTGARWSEVYRELLDTANVTVVGGREGSVGVGGYLLGGGLSFHIGRYGMACNNVVGVEVVLADGRIVNANEKENSDLLKALKGGSNNFGLVTRFDVRAIPAPDLAFGIGVSALDQSEAIQKAFVKFTDKQEKNKDDALINIYSHQNAFSTIQVITVNTEGNMDTKAFKDFDTIPVLVPRIWQRASLADASVGSNETDFETKNTWAVIAIPNDRGLLNEGKNLFDALINTLNAKLGVGKFSILMTNQPLASYLLKIGADKNVLGADRIKGNSLLWNVMVSIPVGENSDAALNIAQEEVKAVMNKMDRLAAAAGGNGWVYLNYAGSWQDPLGSYGPKNVAFMKKVAAKYDPKGFWQKRVPGGFKLSNVKR